MAPIFDVTRAVRRVTAGARQRTRRNHVTVMTFKPECTLDHTKCTLP